MSQTSIDTIWMKIEQVQRGEVTVETATDIIFDWYKEDIEDEQNYDIDRIGGKRIRPSRRNKGNVG